MEGKGEGERNGKGKRKGRGGEGGKGCPAPLSQISGSAPAVPVFMTTIHGDATSIFISIFSAACRMQLHVKTVRYVGPILSLWSLSIQKSSRRLLSVLQLPSLHWWLISYNDIVFITNLVNRFTCINSESIVQAVLSDVTTRN